MLVKPSVASLMAAVAAGDRGAGSVSLQRGALSPGAASMHLGEPSVALTR
jgi:hypothetical protein